MQSSDIKPEVQVAKYKCMVESIGDIWEVLGKLGTQIVQKSTFCDSSRVVWLQECVNSKFCLFDSISGYNEKGK